MQKTGKPDDVNNEEESSAERVNKLILFLQRPEIGKMDPTPESLARYDCAFTHRSFLRDRETIPRPKSGDGDYERLEFLGDRVLNLIVAEQLFRSGDESEGEMTFRMEVVRNMHLGAIVPALGIGFEDMIRLGRKQKLTSRILAGSFEAFVGALYLDSGLTKTRDVVCGLIGEEILQFSPDHNYKKILQEWAQKIRKTLPVYQCTGKSGPDHQPVFSYRVLIMGEVCGKATGSSKAEASQNAARAAIKTLGISSGSVHE